MLRIMRTLVHSLNNFAFPNSLIYTIPNSVNVCIYSPVEHFPVLCRWSSSVIQMCIHTRLELLTIHILLREQITSSQNSLCTKHL